MEKSKLLGICLEKLKFFIRMHDSQISNQIDPAWRPSLPPKPMMHFAYSPCSKEIINCPYFLKIYKIPPLLARRDGSLVSSVSTVRRIAGLNPTVDAT